MDEQEKLLKAQRIKARERARVWISLRKDSAWNTIVEAYDLLIEEWKHENRSFNISASIEDIAKQRIALVYQMKGLESLFHLMETDIETLNQEEQQEENENDGRKQK